MKNFLFSSFWKISALAFAVLVIGGISSKTFAYDSAYYTGNYTPVGCNAALMNVAYLNTGNYTGSDLTGNTIYVFDAGDYSITPVINFSGDCITLVNSGTATIHFINNGYFSAFNRNNILIDGMKINGEYSTLYGIALGNVTNAVIRNTESKYTATNGAAVYFFNVSGSTVSNSILSSHNGIGVMLVSSTYNTISNNELSNNKDGLSLQSSSNYNTVSSNQINTSAEKNLHMINSTNNTFTNNTLTNAKKGLYLDAGSNNNTFTNTYQSNANTGDGLYIYNSSSNTFNGGYFSGNENGVYLDQASGCTFSSLNIANNTYGFLMTKSSYNTINLTNNTNGLYLNNGSNYNNITNTQVLGQNNIYIFSGSNNTITGGVFAATSTTSTSVNANLKNGGTTTVNYTLGGAGLSGAYTGTLGASSTLSLPITLTAGVGTKDITVNYGNGNIFYDSISLGSTPPSGGGGGGGGGGGSLSCTSSQLVCSGGVRTRVSGTSCTSSLIGNACTVGGGTGTETLPVGSIVGSTYSTELNNAYLWAYANGITTMNTIQKANMGGYLIRSHMAKMISNFAITLGGFTPDTTKECTFDDIGNQSAEMKFYIKLSCQLGLMGQGINDFDPSGVVTRAQFGTILSRLIRGNTYEGGIKYYTNHLNALKTAGIMTQISTPTMKELRGYVMLMMKRTYEGGFLNN